MYDLIQIADDLYCASYTGISWPTSSNIYIVLDADGLIAIDSGIDNPDCLSGLSACLDTIDRRIEDIHTILLTHGHPDHVGGANAIYERSQGRILLPELCLPEAVNAARQDFYCLPPETRSVSERMRHFDLMDNFRRTCGRWELEASRVTCIRDGEVLRAGRYRFQSVCTPGHDIGLMCFHEPDHKILFTGDLLRSTGAGSALPWYTSTAGGVEEYLKSLDRVARLDVSTVLPAHGRIDGAFEDMVTDTRSIIQDREAKIVSLLEEGPKTCEQLDSSLYRPIVLRLCPWFATVTEAHLAKLERSGMVKRERLNVERPNVPTFNVQRSNEALTTPRCG